MPGHASHRRRVIAAGLAALTAMSGAPVAAQEHLKETLRPQDAMGRAALEGVLRARGERG